VLMRLISGFSDRPRQATWGFRSNAAGTIELLRTVAGKGRACLLRIIVGEPSRAACSSIRGVRRRWRERPAVVCSGPPRQALKSATACRV
jgi:hypothetical protein